ncbi:MAG: TM0996/MTH895 family glutaredoxin-like protein [Candidatus Aegiribacteria sp.]|nr:TM0996/MTH895 family glutaredoxin-like protein [Candidatus Aegiribacteria sp.]
MKREIKILGTGCPKCIKLAELTEQAAIKLGIDYELDKVTDINDIISYGVMLTPALVVDGDVKIAGSIPSIDQIVDYLR